MLDTLHMAVDPQRGGVEAHLADHFKARLEHAQAFEGGVGADKFILVQQHDAILVLHGDQRLVERTVCASPGCFLLGL